MTSHGNPITGLRPLPRSLDLLSGESLAGYLLRLAHRLDVSPARLAVLTGLADPRMPIIPAGRLLALEPERAASFARATHLSLAEVTGLTLISLASRYPPVNPEFSGRHRQNHGIFVKENWVFSRSSRYCPDCLAGDGSPIQHLHGGGWKLGWRLPIVFACPLHQRLLHHTCPGCQQPAHHRATGQAQLLTLPRHADLHPAQCRNSIALRSGHPRWRACRTRLDDQPDQGQDLPADRKLLRFQTQLLNLLHADTPETVTSVGQDSSPARYFLDLRLISCLITSSWPAVRDVLTPTAPAERAIDEHVRHTRNTIAAVRRSGRMARELAFYDRPPLDSVTCVHLLTLAHQITTATDTDTTRAVLRPLLGNAPSGMSLWIRQFLAGTGHCSPGLHAALGLEIGARHVMKDLGVRSRARFPRPQPVRFGIQHIPQHLLPEWHTDYLAGINDAKPQLVRRAVAARLAQICVGGTVTAAAELLGIPYHASENALTVVKQQLHRRDRDTFDAAVHAIAEHLDTTTSRTDYGKRRDALKAWSISPDEWDSLIAGLPTQPRSTTGRRPFIDWGDSKRLLASIWIWVRITHGEHIFAPASRPDLSQNRPGGTVIRQIHTRWPLINAHQPSGHYTALRQRLEVFADQLAANIDNNEPLW